MNQNITYFPTSGNIDHRQTNNNNNNSGGQNSLPFHSGSTVEFHPTSVAAFHTSNAGSFHTNSVASFVTNSSIQHPISQQNNTVQQRLSTTTVASFAAQQPTTVHVQLVPQGNSPVTSQQQIIITQPLHTPSQTPGGNDPDDRRMAAFMEYFSEQQLNCSTVQTSVGGGGSTQYSTPTNTKYALKNKTAGAGSFEKLEKDQVKRAKQAEAARQRYHRLTADEKKALNLRRTLAQKRKRQREKELSELEHILRLTNDIVDDPEVTEQLREKRMRARWAEAARSRYQRMSSVKNDKGELIKDDDAMRNRIEERNAKKAETARLRYHRMSLEEKQMYNQRRNEAFRRRRMEEEELLSMPIEQITGEALDRAEQIVMRNAKRAEAARLRYQRMTPEQRKSYNQKRYTPKSKRNSMDNCSLESFDCESNSGMKIIIGNSEEDENYDALVSLERDVLRRTQQAQQALMRQRQVAATNGGTPFEQ